MTEQSTRLSQRALRAGGEPIANLLVGKALASPEIVSLAAGFVDHQTLPIQPCSEALEAIWSDPQLSRAALQYSSTAGYLPLREAILERMLTADRRFVARAHASVEQVVITPGSNQLLYLLGDVLLDPGDIVICGSPSYYVFLGTLGNLGARAWGVEVDRHGLVPEAVDETLRHLKAVGQLSRVKAIYLTSWYDNPTGVTIPLERRTALVDVAQRWSTGGTIYLIEDIAYRELRYEGDELPSLWALDAAAETVIVVGSFSKSFSPGVRVGWGILPKALVQPVLYAKGNLDFGSPALNQVLMAQLMHSGRFQAHVEQVRAQYRQKLDALLEAADRCLGSLGGIDWLRPTGGLYVWFRLPESIDTGLSGPLFDAAIQEGVLYVPGAYCYPKEGCKVPRNNLRLSFGIPSCEEIRRGVEALGRAIRRVQPAAA